MEKCLSRIKLNCPSIQVMERLAKSFASTAKFGELILLSGDLGSGKTTFARSYIQRLVDDPKLVVNSPSYLLINTYELVDDSRIHHIDLYRFPLNADLSLIGIPSIYQKGRPSTILIIQTLGYNLIEWPERVNFSTFLPYNPILISITSRHNSREIVLQSYDDESSIRIHTICSVPQLSTLILDMERIQ